MTDPTRQHPSDGPAPSLHVDSDWKAQAEAERTRLAEKEAALQARTAKGGPEQLPPAEFRSLVGLLASQAVMGLGTMADPRFTTSWLPVGDGVAVAIRTAHE